MRFRVRGQATASLYARMRAVSVEAQRQFLKEDRVADLRIRCRDPELTDTWGQCLARLGNPIECQYRVTTSQYMAIRSKVGWKHKLHIKLIHLGLRTLLRYEVSPQHRVEVWIIAEVGFLKERFSFLFGA